jgi:hypothetical protein
VCSQEHTSGCYEPNSKFQQWYTVIVVTEILYIFHPLRLKTQVLDEEIWMDKGLTLGVSEGLIRIGFVIFPFHPKSKVGPPSETL